LIGQHIIANGDEGDFQTPQVWQGAVVVVIIC